MIAAPQSLKVQQVQQVQQVQRVQGVQQVQQVQRVQRVQQVQGVQQVQQVQGVQQVQRVRRVQRVAAGATARADVASDAVESGLADGVENRAERPVGVRETRAETQPHRGGLGPHRVCLTDVGRSGRFRVAETILGAGGQVALEMQQVQQVQGVQRVQRVRCVVAAVMMLAGLVVQAPAAAQSRGRAGTPGAPITYFIADGNPKTGFRASDVELARWALDAWSRSAGRGLRFEPAAEGAALVRVYWGDPVGGEYGETRSFMMQGQRGAEVFVRPDISALGPELASRARADALWRETVVYLTCVHEIGHALGLDHTRDFRDIMFYFGYGGDIVQYFGRYRAQLTTRADIARHSGLSAADVQKISALYQPR